MPTLSEVIYDNRYRDYILSHGFTTTEAFLEQFRDFFPQIINQEFAMIHVPENQSSTVIPEFYYSLTPNLYTTLDLTSLEASGILRTRNQPSLTLHGKGILMGFLDTGIRYTLPAFRTLGGRTRIRAIWDQTIPSDQPNAPFSYGTVYSQEEIQAALDSEDPYALVPTDDTDGHGTYVAGIAAGTPDENEGFSGVADEAEFLIVKLKRAKESLLDYYFANGEGPIYQETDLMTAIEYLKGESRRLNMPLVICIALGSNQGDHAGYTPLDLTLRGLDAAPGIAIVCAAGNEANASHHYFSTLTNQQSYDNVELLIPQDCPGFFAELWGQTPDTYSVGFRSPLGETIPRIPSRLGRTEKVRFYLEDTTIEVNYVLIQNATMSQLIFLRFQNPTPGVWNLMVYNTRPVTGEFHIWLPITGLMRQNITFLAPNPDTTITAPSNSIDLITMGAYNASNGGILQSSSRGYTRVGQVKPDLVAPGVNVTGPGLLGNYISKDGTSAACAITAGASAMMMEWGLRQSPPAFYSTNQIKNFLIRGANRNSMDIWPNKRWGYGRLDLYQVFQAISTN